MPPKKKIRKSEAVQAEIDALQPLVIKALAAHNKSDVAVTRMIKINGFNYGEYSKRAIELQNLQRELIEALARES